MYPREEEELRESHSLKQRRLIWQESLYPTVTESREPVTRRSEDARVSGRLDSDGYWRCREVSDGQPSWLVYPGTGSIPTSRQCRGSPVQARYPLPGTPPALLRASQPAS